MTNTPSTSPELSKLSPEERNTLQDIINDLEGNSPKVGGMDIYILAAYRFVRDHDPYDETKDTLRAIKK